MQQSTVKAKPRQTGGTPLVKKVRREGGVPGVVYGRSFGDPLAVIVDANDLRAALVGHGGSAVLNLEIEGRGSTPAIVQDRQLDVITSHIHTHQGALDRLPGEQRAMIEEASATVRHVRRAVPVAFGPTRRRDQQ